MKKLTFILGLFLMASWTAYGQEVIGHGTIAKRDYSLNQQLPWSDFSLKLGNLPLKRGELKRPGFLSGKYIPIDRIDPFMPIAVPPYNPIKFPIKAIPKDFPSNMPIARLFDPVQPNPVIKGTRENDNYREWKTPGNLPHLSSPLRRLVPHSFE